MKLNHFVIGIAFIIASCSSASAPLVPAENGLDAGREFIDACLKGDFERASYYMLDSKENKAILDKIEKEYREKDKEGRQELRSASINIKEVSEPNDSTVILFHSTSLDTTGKKIIIIKQNNRWLVNANQAN
ncbi:hypothetical protein [Sediminibacterium sp. TEGAF015]|uniref:hypothetical protein n=1 Tax=Sediminibacterium sp. TEGAF015 TaxID=575378 RepID=UPI0021FFC695|nr:hypothetical protein [Sediminibacterium sp. TEGAF015]BDQ11058.1 hypothetical protein TEGAF0_02750 [Sediminibacterium sp. TEGAF015]